MDVKMTLTGNAGADMDAFIDDILDTCLRPAAHAGVLVFYNEARALVGVKDGVLRDSIYRVHSESLSSRTTQAYEVSWNHFKAPHGYNVENGHWRVNELVRTENGTWIATKIRLKTPVRVPAHSFIRRAYDNQADASVVAAQQRFSDLFQEIPDRD